MIFLVMLTGVKWVAASSHVPDVAEIHLTFSDMFDADHPFGQLTLEWSQEVNRRTHGRVQIEIFPNGSLSSPQECFDGVLRGVSDICHTAFAYTPDRFPVMAAADFPGYPAQGNTAQLTTLVANELLRTFDPAELAEVHVFYVHAHPPGALTTIDQPVQQIADLAGLRIRSTGLSARITSVLGGEPVLRPATQTYELLASQEVDATMATFESLLYHRFTDVTDYTLIAPELGYVTTFAVVMRADVWESLPREVQQVFSEVSQEFPSRAAILWDQISLEGYRYALDQEHLFTILSADETARWTESVQTALEKDYVERLETLGLDGQEVLAHRHAVIEEHLGTYPAIDISDNFQADTVK